MQPDIQEKRFQHYENKRLDKIERAIERRKDIIANPDNFFSKVKIKNSWSYNLSYNLVN